MASNINILQSKHIGAVFNISLSTAEMILGLPPILIQNKINRIKHYLKLCMNKAPGDRLIDYISLGNLEKPQELKLAIKEVVNAYKAFTIDVGRGDVGGDGGDGR